MQGGSRYVEGCWGIPYLKIKKVQGFLVLGLLFLFVGWFLDFENLMFSKVICYILPNVHFAFLIDIDLMSKIMEMFSTDLHHFSVPAFSKIPRFIEILLFQNVWGIILDFV